MLNKNELKHLTNFLKVADDYCRYVEDLENITEYSFVVDLLSILSSLYNEALLLPEVMPSDKEGVVVMDSEIKTRVYLDIAKKLEGYRFYFTVLDMFESEEAGYADLADDLTDIYKDIKEAMIIYEMGNDEDRLHAIWTLKFTFKAHWGYHLLDALKALHHIHENFALED
ncbi:DUF5063 domain-containing protein [Paenibacillus alkalitolerans]|uniref:DUF5063 domain-containing protein n=1 Tax=Paenibacillus alkalitolerans TaxID=2799335 RepID=UPI0018F2EE43|nr:DUF5063 domain-containing protein [Paenibacillus alkalitolerans]